MKCTDILTCSPSISLSSRGFNRAGRAASEDVIIAEHLMWLKMSVNVLAGIHRRNLSHNQSLVDLQTYESSREQDCVGSLQSVYDPHHLSYLQSS